VNGVWVLNVRKIRGTYKYYEGEIQGP